MAHVPDSGHAGQDRNAPDPPYLQYQIPQAHRAYGTMQPHQASTAPRSGHSRSPPPSQRRTPPASPASRSTRSNNPPSPQSSSPAVLNAVTALDLATGNHLGRATTSAADARRIGGDQGSHNSRSSENAKHYKKRRNTEYSSSHADTAVAPASPVSSFSFHHLPLPTSSSCYLFVAKHVPIISWLVMRPGYNWRENAVPDLFAGLSVAVVIIPQSVAYALLASLPPVYGLYTSLVPALVYTIFGTSRHMSPGTFAITSLLLGQSVHKILADQGIPDIPPIRNNLSDDLPATPMDPEEYLQRYLSLCLMMTFMIGVFQILFGLARLGRWISRSLVPTPLVSGFNTASAFHIGTHQIKHLLGVRSPRFSGAFSLLRSWVWIVDKFFDKVAWPTLALGVAAILTMVGLQRVERWRRKRSSTSPRSSSTSCAPSASDQALLTVQDVAIERESRLGRQSLDSSLSSASTSPSLSPIRDAPSILPTTTISSSVSPSSRKQGQPPHQAYRTPALPETGLYNTGAAHSRPNLDPHHSNNINNNGNAGKSSKRQSWIHPFLSQDNSLQPPNNYSETIRRSWSEEDYDSDSDDDDDSGGVLDTLDAHSPKYNVHGASGNSESFIQVDECHHEHGGGSKTRPRSTNSDDTLSIHFPVSDRRGSLRSAKATMGNHDLPTTSTPTSASVAGPWTPLLSKITSLSNRDGGAYGCKETSSSATSASAPATTAHIDSRPPSFLNTLCTRYLQPIYTSLTQTHFPIPDIFLCLVFWTGITAVFQLDVRHAIKVIGPIPTGLPSVAWPPMMSHMTSWGDLTPLLWPSFLMALVIYVMTLAVAKHFGKQFEYDIDPDQEMRALGLGSLVGSCFGGYACTGNLTRSAILAQTGAKTPLATLVSCGVVLMTLLWWTALIERVPETVLAAVVLVSLRTLIVQTIEARGLWRVGRRMDAVIWWTTFSTVMIFSIEIGLAVGMGVVMLYQIKKHIRGWKQAVCQSEFCQRIMLLLGLQSPLHATANRGWHAGDEDDDDY